MARYSSPPPAIARTERAQFRPDSPLTRSSIPLIAESTRSVSLRFSRCSSNSARFSCHSKSGILVWYCTGPDRFVGICSPQMSKEVLAYWSTMERGTREFSYYHDPAGSILALRLRDDFVLDVFSSCQMVLQVRSHIAQLFLDLLI